MSTVGGCYGGETKVFFDGLSTAGALGPHIVWLTWHGRGKDGRVGILLWALPRVLPCRLRAVVGEGAVRTGRGRLGVVGIRGARCLGRKRAKRLPMSAKQLRPLRVDIWTGSTVWAKSHIPHIWIDSVGWDEGLRLGGDRCKDTFLLEALTI
jgi:hypothetical protein